MQSNTVTKITERDVVLRERAAYVDAKSASLCCEGKCYLAQPERRVIEAHARGKYPLPPREVTATWSNGKRITYRVVNGELQGKSEGSPKFNKAYHTVETIKALADLVANPTEGE